MKSYTKAGDSGTTALFGGKRVSKSDPQVGAYGEVDELSSFLGFLISRLSSKSDRIFLTNIQRNLYAIMSLLSGAKGKANLESETIKLERQIDTMEKKLPKLTYFILPQGGEISSIAHIARAVCRRAEREVVGYFEKSKIANSKSQILQYLNRLSDFLFILARSYGKKEINTRSQRAGINCVV